MLYEMTQDLGNSLSLQEALAFVGVRLKRLIPYETIAVYIRRDDKTAFRNTSAAKICVCLLRSKFPWGRDFRDGWRRTTSRSSTAIRRSKPVI